MNISELYRKDGGEAYHSNKHLQEDRTIELVSKFRAKKFIQHIAASDKVLEYGVGAGWNLRNIESAEKLGYDVSEILQPMVVKYGIDFTTDSSAIPKEYFDVVICHHVLEHVPDPMQTLQELRSYLKPMGKLLLYVPADTGSRFNSYNPQNKDHHLFNWNVQSMCTLVAECGYTINTYKRSLYGFDRFASGLINKFKLPGFFFYPLFYLLNIVRPDWEISVIAIKGV